MIERELWQDRARRHLRRAVLLLSRSIIGLLAVYGAWSLGTGYAERMRDDLTTHQIIEVQAEPVAEEEPISEKVTTPEAFETSSESSTPRIDLRQLPLLVPVLGVHREELRDSFDEARGAGGSRRHEAIDIHAPRNRPVIAAEAGTILAISETPRGGKSLRQLSATGRYVYFYAHLERYAGGLRTGDIVRRGQTIGYVGTSGNAADDAPHLHFAISDVSEDPRGRRGPPVNPYPILRSNG